MESVSWRSGPGSSPSGGDCGSEAERLDSSYGSESLSGRLESASYRLQQEEEEEEEGGPGGQGQGQGQGSQGQGQGREGQGSQGQGWEGQGSQGREGQGSQGQGSQWREGQGSQGQGREGQGSQGQGWEGQGSQGQGWEDQGSQGQWWEGQGSQGQGREGQGSQSQGSQWREGQGNTQGSRGLGREGLGKGSLGSQGEPKAGSEQDCAERLDSSYGSQSLTESLSEALEHSCRLDTAGDLPAPTEDQLNPYTFLGEDGDSIVHLAIIHKAEECALYFISYFTVEVLDIQNDLFQSALHLAVYTEQLNIVQELLQKGVNLNPQDWDGNTPLHLACQHQLVDCVRLLTSNTTGQKVNMELQNWQGRTCLHIATLTRNQTILAMLLQAGSNINSQDGTSGKSSLHLSVECGDRALVRFLLKMGAAVNAVMYNGCSALHLAVGRWDTQTADILCQAGADPLLANVEGDTAWDLASDNIDILALFPFDDIKLMGRPVTCSDF